MTTGSMTTGAMTTGAMMTGAMMTGAARTPAGPPAAVVRTIRNPDPQTHRSVSPRQPTIPAITPS
jgi:hypothetical protein